MHVVDSLPSICPSCVIIFVEGAGIINSRPLQIPQHVDTITGGNQAHCGVYLWVCGHYGEEVGLSEETYLASIWQ